MLLCLFVMIPAQPPPFLPPVPPSAPPQFQLPSAPPPPPSLGDRPAFPPPSVSSLTRYFLAPLAVVMGLMAVVVLSYQLYLLYLVLETSSSTLARVVSSHTGHRAAARTPHRRRSARTSIRGVDGRCRWGWRRGCLIPYSHIDAPICTHTATTHITLSDETLSLPHHSLPACASRFT